MSILTRAAAALGRTLTAATARDVIKSPWSDSSHLESVILKDLYGQSAALPIDRSRAIRIPTVAKARRIICSRIGTLPFRELKNGQPAPTTTSLFEQPEAGLPLPVTLTWTADDLLFFGRSWWLVTDRYHTGYPARVRRVPPHEAQTDTDGQLVTAFGRDVDPADGIRIDAPDEGLLIEAADTIRRAITLNRSAARAEANPVPVVNLHNTSTDPLKPSEIDAMIEQFEAARQVSGVGYTSKSLEVQTFGAQPENLLIDGRKQIILELTRHTGLTASDLDAPIEGSSLTYTNRVTENQRVIDNALSPYMSAITARLSMPDVLPAGRTVELSTDALVKPDRRERWTTLKLGLEAGIVTLDEARELEGLPKLDQQPPPPAPAPAGEDDQETPA